MGKQRYARVEDAGARGNLVRPTLCWREGRVSWSELTLGLVLWFWDLGQLLFTDVEDAASLDMENCGGPFEEDVSHDQLTQQEPLARDPDSSVRRNGGGRGRGADEGQCCDSKDINKSLCNLNAANLRLPSHYNVRSHQTLSMLRLDCLATL